jgi:hypothetical protein
VSIPALGRIDIIRGQALDIVISVPDAIDLTGSTALFGIAGSKFSAYTLTLTATVLGQTLLVPLTGSQSEELNQETHYYSCWLVIAGDPTPIARGIIGVTADSRNR